MARNKLNEKQKDRVVELHAQDVKQSDIAYCFGVSRRTVQRALVERGVLQTQRQRSEEDEQILKIVRDRGLSPIGLKQALGSPVLSPENVRAVLTNMTSEQLGTYFYSVVQEKVLRNQQLRDAALAKARMNATGSAQQESLPV